jgi:hypothetical protein
VGRPTRSKISRRRSSSPSTSEVEVSTAGCVCGGEGRRGFSIPISPVAEESRHEGDRSWLDKGKKNQRQKLSRLLTGGAKCAEIGSLLSLFSVSFQSSAMRLYLYYFLY